ncbi:hypothetical protein ACFY2N_08830 [Streptomyces rubiginosohelvolus]|uniref:hypothetical protein n=1 Tax=Streptomyces rubiginosohelvolus TaxID=67362 RepID=UPI0036A13408
MEVHVHGIVAGQPVGMVRTDGGDPSLQRGTATVVPAQWLVQAVAGAVLTQEQPGGGDIGMPGEPAGLQPVEFEGLNQTTWATSSVSGTGQPARRSTRLTVSGPASMSATRLCGRHLSTERRRSARRT